jgi:hypothetical protein
MFGPFGLFYCHFIYFMAISYILWSFWHIFPAWVCCTKKTLAKILSSILSILNYEAIYLESIFRRYFLKLLKIDHWNIFCTFLVLTYDASLSATWDQCYDLKKIFSPTYFFQIKMAVFLHKLHKPLFPPKIMIITRVTQRVCEKVSQSVAQPSFRQSYS